MVTPKYQLFPPLTGDEYQALKADIAQHGILVPIEKDESGNILDGHHRIRAWEELRAEGTRLKDYPTLTRHNLNENEKLNHVRSLNLLRRHLTTDQQKPHWVEMRQSGMTYQAIAEKSGVDRSTVEKSVCENSQTQPAIVTGKDGKHYPAKKPSQPKTTYNPGTPSPKRTDKERKRPELNEQYNTGIRRGDFREVLIDIPEQSVKLILTDPPYGKQYLNLWDDLGKFATRVLRNDGALITYSGQLYLPQVINSLSSYLDWWWLCGLIHDGLGNLTPLGQPVRKVINQFKPILMFVPKGGGVDVVFRDLINGHGKSKEMHNWQQNTHEAFDILKTFCQKGDLIVDPFAGSGSIGKAATDLELVFIGAEILEIGQG